MSMPFYVSPDQMMQDRADFARKGIARGRSVIAARCADGIALVAENPSVSLHKISEIYDRIGFAAVGRYNEFEALRVQGIRYADLRGYAYDRADVTSRGLANSYAQLLGASFSSGADKPFEVQLCVAEVGEAPERDRLFVIDFDGSILQARDFAVMGGHAEPVVEAMEGRHDADGSLAEALRSAVAALRVGGEANAGDLEVALLDRSRLGRRAFVRLDAERIAGLVGDEA